MANKTGAKAPRKSTARQNTARGKKEWKFFYMFVVTVIFIDEQQNSRQRTMNILVEQDEPHIIKHDMSMVNRGAMARMAKENNIQPDRVREIIMQNAFPLGHMHPDTFYTDPDQPVEPV